MSGGRKPSSNHASYEYQRGERIRGTSFVVCDPLGKGAFGTVYDCEHRKLGVRSAVKLLNAELSGRPDLEALMLAEARRTAQIENDHVVKIRSIGMTKETPPRLYVEMFKLEGESLYAVLRAAGRLEVLEAILYGLHIATGLAGAHGIGIVHCDVKPANIFLARIYDPMARAWVTRAVVLDLGVAQIASRSPFERRPFAGTAVTAAPEQHDGRFYPQSDVYALGVTLFMMLTGTHPHGPFSSPRDLMCAKIVPERIKRLRNVLPAVSEGAFVDPLLDDLLWRMMQPEYTERPATMEHVIAELSLIQTRQEDRELAAALAAKGKVKPKGRGAATTPEPPEAMRARMRDHYTSQNEDMPSDAPEDAPPSIDGLLEGIALNRRDEQRADAVKRQIERYAAGVTNSMMLPEDRRPQDASTHVEEERARRTRAREAADDMGAFDLDASTGSSRLDMSQIEETAPMPGAPPLPARNRRANEPEATGHGRAVEQVAAAQTGAGYATRETSADREFFLGGKSTQPSVADAPFDRRQQKAPPAEGRVKLSELPRPDRRFNDERRASTFAGASLEHERETLQSWFGRRSRQSALFGGVMAGLVVLFVGGIAIAVVLRVVLPSSGASAVAPERTSTSTSPSAAAPTTNPRIPPVEPVVTVASSAPPPVAAVPPRPTQGHVVAPPTRVEPSPTVLSTAAPLPVPAAPPAPVVPAPSMPTTPHGALIQ